jgi:FtsZ-binding cell division protein ZapB
MNDISTTAILTERIYKTPIAVRRAIDKYNLNKIDLKEIKKSNYLKRREDPAYVLKCQLQCRAYQLKKKEEKSI